MNRTKKAGLSVKSGLSLMCIVCLLCGLLCGFFWLAGESSALAAGPDGSAPAAKTVVSGDVSLAAPEHDEKLAVQAAAQATSPVVRTVAVGMDAGDYTETVTCDYTPVYVDDRFGGYCYVLDDAVWLPADAFAEMLGLESDTVTDGDTETVTVDGADIAATYGETYYTANGRCFYAPDGVYALDGEVVLPLADLEKIFGVTAVLSEDPVCASMPPSRRCSRAARAITARVMSIGSATSSMPRPATSPWTGRSRSATSCSTAWRMSASQTASRRSCSTGAAVWRSFRPRPTGASASRRTRMPSSRRSSPSRGTPRWARACTSSIPRPATPRGSTAA